MNFVKILRNRISWSSTRPKRGYFTTPITFRMNSNRDTDRYINRYYEDKGIGDRIKLEEKEGRRGDRRRWEEEEEGVTTESLFRAGTFTPKFDLGKGFVDFVRARGGGGEGRGFMLDMDYR